MINSRAKGKNGELQLFKKLSLDLGFIVERNLDQTRGGGADTISIPGWRIEVKRVEKDAYMQWWQQTIDQCGDGEKPMLFYRANRQPWKAMLRVFDINPDLVNRNYVAVVEYECACLIIRESIGDEIICTEITST